MTLPSYPTAPSPQTLPPRAPKPNGDRRVLLLVIGAATLLGLLMVFGVVGLLTIAYLTQDRVPSGVSVAGVEIGGDTAEQAAAALGQVAANQAITATDGDRQWTVTLRDLGISVDTQATLQAALEAGRGSTVQPIYTIDLNQTQLGLIALSEQVNIAAVPSDPPQMGRAVEIPVILDRLRTDVNGELADGVLDLTMIEVAPPEPEPVSQQNYSGPSVTHVVESGQELALIARQYGVTMDDIVTLNNLENPDFIFVGQELLIPAAGEYTPSAEDIPAAPTSSGKSIVVSTQDQRIYAYENGQLVRTHLVSTGRDATPTVLGDYQIYVKYVADDMQGADYFLPQVPYTMYFYQGYGIHGTYWHNSFGRPMSHGCVNLPVDEAEWFFNWASVGTTVRVI
ncbi:MAG: L,D-transpeptidase family protein [bacterium]|nr:L,D-transpeptidase family protein [bacterium]